MSLNVVFWVCLVVLPLSAQSHVVLARRSGYQPDEQHLTTAGLPMIWL